MSSGSMRNSMGTMMLVVMDRMRRSVSRQRRVRVGLRPKRSKGVKMIRLEQSSSPPFDAFERRMGFWLSYGVCRWIWGQKVVATCWHMITI
jgi:hypothetical protein